MPRSRGPGIDLRAFGVDHLDLVAEFTPCDFGKLHGAMPDIASGAALPLLDLCQLDRGLLGGGFTFVALNGPSTILFVVFFSFLCNFNLRRSLFIYELFYLYLVLVNFFIFYYKIRKN